MFTCPPPPRFKKAEERVEYIVAMKTLLPMIYQRMMGILPDTSLPSVNLQHHMLKIFYATMQVGRHKGLIAASEGFLFGMWEVIPTPNGVCLPSVFIANHNNCAIHICNFYRLSRHWVGIPLGFGIVVEDKPSELSFSFWYVSSLLQYALPLDLMNEGSLPGWIFVFQTIIQRPVPPVS